MPAKIYWSADAQPENTTLHQILYDLRQGEEGGLVLDSVTMADIIGDADGGMVLDALITPLGQLQRKMDALKAVMDRAGGTLKVSAVQISEPFTKKGAANVAAVFELGDGQTVTIYFHNPDTTPKKILPTDDLVSWKWLLNKKDITIVVAKENGQDLMIREVARRIMKLAEKNSPAFTKANAKRAEKMQEIEGLKTEVDNLENDVLPKKQNELEIVRVEYDDWKAAKQDSGENLHYSEKISKILVDSHGWARTSTGRLEKNVGGNSSGGLAGLSGDRLVYAKWDSQRSRYLTLESGFDNIFDMDARDKDPAAFAAEFDAKTTEWAIANAKDASTIKVSAQTKEAAPAQPEGQAPQAPATKPQAVEALSFLRKGGFLGGDQLTVIGSAMRGEEKDFFIQKVVDIAEQIKAMPKTMEQDGMGDQAVAYLHYFKGGSDFYITEKDSEDEQLQAYGLADIGYGGELGYISLVDLTKSNVELDLYWTPKTLAEITGKGQEEPAAPVGAQPAVEEPAVGETAEEDWKAKADAFGAAKQGYIGTLAEGERPEKALEGKPLGSWITEKGSIGYVNWFSLENGQYAAGDFSTTIEEAYVSMRGNRFYPESIPEGRENKVKTAKGTKVATGFAVREADKLIASHDAQGNPNPEYPQTLQPRDRSRESSQAWILKTANNLDPESLGRTSRADSGAPIVGPDLVVESGNGRTMAIKEAYRIGKADEYRAWLEAEAEYFGINPAKIRAMKKPVLVRIRTSEVDRRAFAVEANQTDLLTMTATEKARADAKRLTDALVSKMTDNGDLTANANRSFILGFLQDLGDAEAAQYVTTDGNPTASLVARVQAAIFAKAYADDRLLELTADVTKPETANILAALNVAAPAFIRAMQAERVATEKTAETIADGIEASMNKEAVDAIIGAVNALRKAKEAGLTADEFVRQDDMFGDIDPDVAAMVLFIDANNRSAKRLGSAFKAMAEFIGQQAEAGRVEDIFGNSTAIAFKDIVDAANRKMRQEFGDDAKTIDLFSLPAEEVAAPAPESRPAPSIQPASPAPQKKFIKFGRKIAVAKKVDIAMATSTTANKLNGGKGGYYVGLLQEDGMEAKPIDRLYETEAEAEAEADKIDLPWSRSYLESKARKLAAAQEPTPAPVPQPPAAPEEAHQAYLVFRDEKWQLMYNGQPLGDFGDYDAAMSSAARFKVVEDLSHGRAWNANSLRWEDVSSLKAVAAPEDGELEAARKRIDQPQFKSLTSDFIRSLAVIKNLDEGVEKGWNRSAFVNSIVGKIRRQADNGDTQLAGLLLAWLDNAQAGWKKPAITPKNGVWSVAEWQKYSPIFKSAGAAVVAPEPATEPTPRPAAKNKTVQQLDQAIMVAADGIEKLRGQDVERVMYEADQMGVGREKMADYIRAKRPDLAFEVDAVMQQADDRELLQAVIDGDVSKVAPELAEGLLDEKLGQMIENIYNRNADDPDMAALFERAVMKLQEALLATFDSIRTIAPATDGAELAEELGDEWLGDDGGVMDSAVLDASNDMHWVTTKSGSHILIQGNARKGFTVRGGAGGKFNGQKWRPSKISKPAKAKEFHEMTREEFHQAHANKPVKREANSHTGEAYDRKGSLDVQHRRHIRSAKQGGKAIPAHVQEDFKKRDPNLAAWVLDGAVL